jgi:hypothetical protein
VKPLVHQKVDETELHSFFVAISDLSFFLFILEEEKEGKGRE